MCMEKREAIKIPLFRNIINKENMEKKQAYNELLNLKAELIGILNEQTKGILSERGKSHNSLFVYMNCLSYCIKTLLTNK